MLLSDLQEFMLEKFGQYGKISAFEHCKWAPSFEALLKGN